LLQIRQLGYNSSEQLQPVSFSQQLFSKAIVITNSVQAIQLCSAAQHSASLMPPRKTQWCAEVLLLPGPAAVCVVLNVLLKLALADVSHHVIFHVHV